MSIAKVVKLGKKGQIVIPKSLRDTMGIKEGDLLIVTVESDQLHLIPPDRYANATRGILKGLWGKDIQEINDYIQEERKSWG